MKDVIPSGHISDRIIELCTSTESVSSLIAKDASLTPGDAWGRLYGNWKAPRRSGEDRRREHVKASPEELDKAASCGKWGPTKPSELFLRMYHDALCTLEEDPSHAVVSPSLMGSCGAIPLTIISVIPDIVRHMSNLIVRAEREVYLATNYWQESVASKFITDAIRELDRRAGQRRTRIVFKIIYDRGSPKQLFEPHYYVPSKEYSGKNVSLPTPAELPNIDLQVINFHTPLMGTFHAKYMVVDRKVAVLQSNNIQDNDNLEMMIHLEGPIVDSLYDMALVSWHRKLDPPMPSRDAPASNGGTGQEPGLNGAEATGTEVEGISPKIQPEQTLPEHTLESPHYDDDMPREVARAQSAVSSKPGETHMQAVARLLNHSTNPDFKGNPAPECPVADEMTPYITHSTKEPIPMALVNRPPYGPPNHKSVSTPQNAAWLSALRNATRSVFIQTPTLNAEPLIPAIRDACERGVDVSCYVCLGYNDAGELLPRQGGHNEMVAHNLYKSLSPAGRERLHYFWYVAKDQTRPLVQATRRRSCHIKLLIVDEQVAVHGNGNQDTQSWLHSQEINAMIDSTEVCRDWIDALRRNQNTHEYGALSREDGVWRDADGKEADGVVGAHPNRARAWAKGFLGAIKRVQGTGGF